MWSSSTSMTSNWNNQMCPTYGNQSLNGNQIAQKKYSLPGVDGDQITKIAHLSGGVVVQKILGLVIAKDEPRHFPSKKDPSIEQYLFNFTIRDSEVDIINVTCWGKEDFIYQTSASFHIGDVVTITNCLSQTKSGNGCDDRFRPMTPSLFQLSVNENRGSVTATPNLESAELIELAHVSPKAPNDYFTIADIITNGPNLNGQFISLLVAVKKVGAVKEFTSKNGKSLKRCELVVLDETAQSFSVTFWDAEQIQFVQRLAPKDFIVFIADVLVKYDDFKKCMSGTATSKTILTMNPDTREAQRLFEYAQTLDITEDTEDDDRSMSFAKPTIQLSSITSVKNIASIKHSLLDQGQEYLITYAFISHFDIDGDSTVVVQRCSQCRFRLDASTGTCINHECQQGSRFDIGPEETQKDVQFEIRISLADYTGTLEGCLLAGEAASEIIGLSAADFQALDITQKTAIKWRYLLERCKVYLKISPGKTNGRGFVRVLSFELADPKETVQYLAL